MASYLVTAVDAQGRLRLVSTEDGKRLLTNDGCDDCCNPGGDCATLRRYNRCPATDDTRGCQSEPDHLWVCDRADLPATGKENNSCYSRTDTTIPTAQIPVGDVLLIGFDTRYHPTGCDDPICTECLHFYRAEPCPGQDMTGFPPVFILVQDLPPILPGQDCAGGGGDFGLGRGVRCFTIRPGPTYTRAEVDAAGGVIVLRGDVSPNFKCCQCDPRCNIIPRPTYNDCGLGTRTINLECCCSYEWTATATMTWTEVTTNVGATQTTVFTRSASGSVSWRSDELPGIRHAILVHEEALLNGAPDPGAIVNDFLLDVPFAGACAPGPVGPIGPGFCPFGGPFRVNGIQGDGSYEIVLRADQYVTCNTTSTNYRYQSWAGDQPGVPRIDNTFTYSFTVRHTGQCGGGCGQATGQAHDAAGAVLAKQQATAVRLAVPYDKWPLWAKAVALGKAPEDKGVGDTIKRTLGGAGAAFEEWYQRVVGKDCGCRDRAAHLSSLYPYPKAV